MNTLTTGTYIAALPVDQMFADPAYQRELDVNRAKTMSLSWNPRLIGTIDVSDRGGDGDRYAIINGQHRVAAARLIDPGMSIACNVHSGLTPGQEARLFWDIDRSTKKLSTWDRWHARSTAGDKDVVAIENVCAEFGYSVTQNPGARSLQCCAALEFLVERCELQTIREVLEFIGDVWPEDPESRKANIIKGLGLALHDYAGVLNTGLLADALSSITPAQLVARAHELKSRGWDGGIPKLTEVSALRAYNRTAPKSERVQLP